MPASDPERSPLLGADDPADETARSSREEAREGPSESTPLLSDAANGAAYGDEGSSDEPLPQSASSTNNHGRSKLNKSKRWPLLATLALLLVLTLSAVTIIVLASVLPGSVEEYAKEAVVVEPTNLSLESITADGVRARIQANFRLDGARVRDDRVRQIGRFVTSVMGVLETEETSISVYLPEYGNTLLGTAAVPPLSLKIADKQNNVVDFIAELRPGDAEGIRNIANDWLEGRIDSLQVQGKADVQLKSGAIPLGTHSISESFTFEAKNVPALPKYEITRLNFSEMPIPGEAGRGMAADVSVSAYNNYPVSLEIPALGFDILVPGCSRLDPYILVASALTSPVAITPLSSVTADVHGVIRELPATLTHACPDSTSSPLDLLLKDYLNGKEATVFVRGRQTGQDANTPPWLGELLSSVTVPVPFPSRSFDNLIRNFSLTDVHFSLPDPDAKPGDPDSDPKVSGTIQVIAALPSEMNFDLNVTRVRATADVIYHGNKLGELNVREWQPANSSKIEQTKEHDAGLKIQSRVDDAPLNVTDGDVLTEVIQSLLFKGKVVLLDVDAAVDVTVNTVLGTLVLKGVPAKGKIPVKPLRKGSMGDLKPQVGNIRVLDTTESSLTLQALVNITNPTNYTAHVPFVSVYIANNGTLLGEAIARDLDIVGGINTNLVVSATWNPSMGGEDGQAIGRQLLSEYLSGFNATVDVKAHRDTFPLQPIIGEALSKINLTVKAPPLDLPSDGDDGTHGNNTHFIRDATFHIFSSTATFTLVSPFRYNTLYIDHVNATAFYNHTDPVGQIEYDLPFAAPPGASQTPKLPVEWSLDSVGYEKVRKALGGRLKLDAKAVVGVRMGSWTETVWYEGRGIGASIRL